MMITRSATLLLLLLLLLVDPTTSSTAAASSGGMIIISSGRSSLESTSHANLLVPDLATPRSEINCTTSLATAAAAADADLFTTTS